MTALETLEHFKQQAEAEIAALEHRCTSLATENKSVKAELTTLRQSVTQVSAAAHRYAEEYRTKANEARTSEIALRASRLVMQDELTNTARELQQLAEKLNVPEQVLYEHGYSVKGVNPLHEVREVKKRLTKKVQALAGFGG